jgi:hypothetical protein
VHHRQAMIQHLLGFNRPKLPSRLHGRDFRLTGV